MGRDAPGSHARFSCGGDSRSGGQSPAAPVGAARRRRRRVRQCAVDRRRRALHHDRVDRSRRSVALLAAGRRRLRGRIGRRVPSLRGRRRRRRAHAARSRHRGGQLPRRRRRRARARPARLRSAARRCTAAASLARRLPAVRPRCDAQRRRDHSRCREPAGLGARPHSCRRCAVVADGAVTAAPVPADRCLRAGSLSRYRRGDARSRSRSRSRRCATDRC